MEFKTELLDLWILQQAIVHVSLTASAGCVSLAVSSVATVRLT
jgi:hypothetical protein